MKILFDANLSPKLVRRLSELFPNSTNVFDAGLSRQSPDELIWNYAANHGYTIITADSDFLALAAERGTPPNVVRIENCVYRTAVVEALLRRHAVRIAELDSSGRPVPILRHEP